VAAQPDATRGSAGAEAEGTGQARKVEGQLRGGLGRSADRQVLHGRRDAGPAIAATARQFGIDPGTLMQRLNAMPADKVEKLVHSANTVNPNDKGHYQLTAGNDREVWGPEGKDPQFGGHYLYDTAYRGGYGIVAGSPFPVADTDPNPHSLTALRGYARALTGEPLLG